MTRILINQQTVGVYPSKTTRDKTSAMRNVHVLCSNCPPPATTQARSLLPLPSHTVFVDEAVLQLIPLIHNALW